MPLPCSRKRRPDCVPSGTLTLVLPPSIVGTSQSPPIAAVTRNRNAAMQVGALALKKRMRADRQENIEIAGRTAAHAGLALTGEPDAGAILDAGRNVHRQSPLARDPARPRA